MLLFPLTLLLLLLLPCHYSLVATNKCIAVDSNEKSQCLYCPSTSFVNDKSIFVSSSFFNLLSCYDKDATAIFKKEVYISSLTTDCNGCDGTIQKPYVSL